MSKVTNDVTATIRNAINGMKTSDSYSMYESKANRVSSRPHHTLSELNRALEEDTRDRLASEARRRDRDLFDDDEVIVIVSRGSSSSSSKRLRKLDKKLTKETKARLADEHWDDHFSKPVRKAEREVEEDYGKVIGVGHKALTRPFKFAKYVLTGEA